MKRTHFHSKSVRRLCGVGIFLSRCFSSSHALKPVVTTDNSQFITISPPENVPVIASMTFCHGLGDTSYGWASTMHEVVAQIPGLRCILPTAPTQPVTLNAGYRMPSWYDIKGLDDRSDEDCKGIEDSRSTILKLIENEKKVYGLLSSKIIIGGFSQGGAMSLYTGLQYDGTEPLGGVLCMSGYLPNSSHWKLSGAGIKTPVCMCHGEIDPVVKFWMAEKSKNAVQSAGLKAALTWNVYKDLEHSATEEELDDVIQWIKSVLQI